MTNFNGWFDTCIATDDTWTGDEFTARDVTASLWYVFLSTYAFSDVCVYQQNMYIIQ